MNINHAEHPVQLLIACDTEEKQSQIDLKLFVVRKEKEADHYYRSKVITLAEEVTSWLKDQLIRSFKSFQQPEGDESKFAVSDYHLEVQKNEQLAKLVIQEQHSTLNTRKNGLLHALTETDQSIEERDTHFQIIRLDIEQYKIYCCFYRKPKVGTKKRRLAIKDSNVFHFVSDDLLELGGKIDFFILTNEIYISNLLSFENMFDYRDHINEARDYNLHQIVNLPFFAAEESNKDIFEQHCKQHVYSRSLAQLSADNIAALEDNFEERCDELKLIRKRLPRNAQKAEEYRKKYAAIWELYSFLDLEHYQIKYEPDQKPTTLIHFFADKIKQSFLTKNFSIAVDIDPLENDS